MSWGIRSCAELRKLHQDRNQNPIMCSHVSKEDKPSQRSCTKLQQGNVPNSSESCGKLQQAIEIQLEKTKLDDHNLQVTDYEYVENVFKNLGHKLSRSENDEVFDLTTNALICGLCRRRRNRQFILAANINKTWSRGGTRTSRSPRRCSISLWDWSWKYFRKSEFTYHDLCFLSLDEIDSVSWSSHQVGESKSACPLRFSLVSGKAA